MLFEEIHGFRSPGEYDNFLAFLDREVGEGRLIRVPADPTYRRGEVLGGQWFEDAQTGHVWRLIPPDPPFRGLWEPVHTSESGGSR